MSRTPVVTTNESVQAAQHYLDFSDMRPGQLVANAPVREWKKLHQLDAKARFERSIVVGLNRHTLVIGPGHRKLQAFPAGRLSRRLVGSAIAAVTDVQRAIQRALRRVVARRDDVVAGVRGETATRMLFDALADYWISETRFTSSFIAITQHPGAELLVRLGRPIVPFLVERLEDDPDRFGYILARITEAQPVPEDAGSAEVAPAWRTWLDDHDWI